MKKKSKFLISDPKIVYERTLDAQSPKIAKKTPFRGSFRYFKDEILNIYEKGVDILD